MGVNFQRKIRFVIIPMERATKPINSMRVAGSRRLDGYLALMTCFTIMFAIVHKSAGDVVNYSSILPNSSRYI